ncbi:MAG: hypothetical protein V3U52_03750 [Thermoplasmata archaeon]
MGMRSASGLALLVVISILAGSSQTAEGQVIIELPSYSEGDFWTYETLLPSLAVLPDGEGVGIDIELHGNLTIRIEGLEQVDIGGSVREVYNTSQSLDVEARGALAISFGNVTTDATFSGSITLNASIYLDREGLEPLRIVSELKVDLGATVESPGFEVTLPVEANGTLAAMMEYTNDNWTFPLGVGQRGEEEFRMTGEGYVQVAAFGNTSESSESLEANGTLLHHAEGEKSLDVPAGTFGTLVVNSTLELEEGLLPLAILPGAAGYELAYWSSEVGAPVRREMYNDVGELQAELSLTAYRYQSAEFLTVLGLRIIHWVGIIVAAAVAVAVLVLIMTRQRPPVQINIPPETEHKEETVGRSR